MSWERVSPDAVRPGDRISVTVYGVAGSGHAPGVLDVLRPGGTGVGLATFYRRLEPDFEGYVTVHRRRPEPVQVTLSTDAQEALRALLGLVHYDDLAADMYALLPEELRRDVLGKEER